MHLQVSGEEINDPSRLHHSAIIAEVSRRREAPVQGTGDPLLHALHVQLDVLVDTVPPRWDSLLVLDERIDTLLAHLADAVYSLLKAELFMCHENVDQVMRLAERLFVIVRVYILKRPLLEHRMRDVTNEWHSRWPILRGH